MKKKLKNRTATEAMAPAGPSASADGLRLGFWMWAGAAAFAATFIGYIAILKAPFVFDDLSGVFLYPNAAEIPFSRWFGVTRPLTNLTFWLNFKVGGIDPTLYHWVNLLLHFASGVLVALIVRKLLEASGTLGVTRDLLAAFSGFIFLLHPLQTEAVSYVSSRSETLAVFLLWAAFAHFLYRKRQAASWYDAVVILVVFGLACLSKEYSVVFPALLLLADYYWNPGFSFKGIRKNWRVYGLIAAAAVPAGLLILRVLRQAGTVGFGLKGLSMGDYFLTECRVIWVYLFKFILPINQTIDYDFGVSHSLADPVVLAGLSGLIAVTVAAVLYRKEYPLASFGWIAFLILLAPTSSLLPIQDVIAERRVYLPSLALLLMAVEFLRRLNWTYGRQAVLVAIVLVFGYLTSERNTVWSTPENLWHDAVLKAPEKSRPHFQLAKIFYDSGRFDAAMVEYEAAARTGGRDATLLLDWGLALDDAGKPKEALEKLNQAAQMQPSAHVYSQIGRVYGRDNQDEKALEALAKAEQLDPNFEMTYVYRGNVYLNQGDPAKATAEYKRALALNPANGPALENLRLAAQDRR
jgi:tetratricopeptide (TPR) repeat protein